MAEISISEVTTGYIDGTGVFDTLMCAIEARLEVQFKLGRIKGSDYATVYLGATQTAMQQALQFVLGKQQADKQAELLEAQAAALASELAIKEAQSNADLLVKAEQISASKSDTVRKDNESAQNTLRLQAEVTKVNAEEALTEQKIKTEKAQIVDEVDGVTVAGLVGKQKAYYNAQTDAFSIESQQRVVKSAIELASTAIAVDGTSPITFPSITLVLNELLDNTSVTANFVDTTP